LGWKWAPIGGLQYRTYMQAPKYDVQFLRSEALRSSSSSSSSSSINSLIRFLNCDDYVIVFIS